MPLHGTLNTRSANRDVQRCVRCWTETTGTTVLNVRSPADSAGFRVPDGYHQPLEITVPICPGCATSRGPNTPLFDSVRELVLQGTRVAWE